MKYPKHRVAVFGLGLILLAGCRDEPSPVGPASIEDAAGPRTSTTSAPPRSVRRPNEAHLAELAGQLQGGFGGFGFARDGSIHVYLQDLSHGASAKGAVAALLRGRMRGRRHQGPVIPEIRIVKGNYTFLQLADWRDRMNDPVLDVQGTAWTDLDQGANRLAIGVATDSARSAVEGKLRELGIPLAAVTFERALPIMLQDTLVQDPGEGCPPEVSCSIVEAPAPEYAAGDSLGAYVRPLQAGLQIAFTRPSDPSNSFRKCTLGFIANYGGSTDGTLDYVTAAHCTITQNSREGTRHYQPRLRSNWQIGAEIEDPTGIGCGTFNFYRCRYSDASVGSLIPGVQADYGYIARTTFYAFGRGGVGSRIINQSNPRFRITGDFLFPNENDQYIEKMGATTGWTYGQLHRDCVDFRIGRFTTWCASLATYGSAGGDSGGPIFVWNYDDTVTLIGTHVGTDGTYAVYNHLENIRSDLPHPVAVRP